MLKNGASRTRASTPAASTAISWRGTRRAYQMMTSVTGSKPMAGANVRLAKTAATLTPMTRLNQVAEKPGCRVAASASASV